MSAAPTGSDIVPSSGLVAAQSVMRAQCLESSTKAAESRSVVVVGAGTQGIATAYWLGRAGHKVTVVERGASGSLGSAASYTGLLHASSGCTPLLARPHAFRAFKIQWCPYTNYMHPDLRVGLFDSDVAQRVRVGMTPFSTRSQYLASAQRLYGLGLFNGYLLNGLLSEWAAAKGAKAADIPVVRSAVSLVFDDRTWADVRSDLETQNFIHDAGTSAPKALTAILPIASTDESPSRFRQADDLQLVAHLPSLKPREYQLAGGVVYQDEYAVDQIAVLNKLKQESADKFGVKFLYNTEATHFTAAPATTAAASIASVQTSAGPITADAFVLCAGANSKHIVHQSQLSSARVPISTFTTKIHHLSFPNAPITAVTPATSSSSAASSTSPFVIPALSVLLPETHTVITAFPKEVRVSSGEVINDLEELIETPASGLPSTRLTPTLRLEPAKLKQLVDDVQGVYPALTRDIISQNGTVVPHVSTRTWSLDNKPLLGRYHPALSNLFVNGAHGNLGWTNALAAGKHVSDIVGGMPTFIDPEPFDPARFFKQ